MALLTTNTPFMLGFDSLERLLDRAAKNSESYPPYNIEQIDPSHLQITVAVAGFAEKDLTIELENRQLLIRGQHAAEEKEKDRQFLYRGIASRQFVRSFVLADGIEVVGAHLENGLLQIDLEQIEPENNVRQIKISKKQEKKAPEKITKNKESEEKTVS
ncbi:MAG: Hsp20 family protein [Alphaproteobacteria bacterium]